MWKRIPSNCPCPLITTAALETLAKHTDSSLRMATYLWTDFSKGCSLKWGSEWLAASVRRTSTKKVDSLVHEV